ncbi:unnamed protein product [Mycena citricolor]|uniref:Rho GTPase activation protein n=1 Tax=Mycena citricolor TaxID=2018698 RepID=A0AAD2GVM7_9AGAR|nr:unnamed protein product [Mycena citricolor]CAK5280224.1 unnamed protein product [Mycena citricolor]
MSAGLKEFLVSAEIYVSPNAAGAAALGFRKPAIPKRKVDKRDSVRPGAPDDKKLREKNSWHTLARGTSGSGQWRQATCTLTEEGSRCLLNIYIDDSFLFQTVFIHLLNNTDIRFTDRSLFFRKDCLGIFCLGSQRWVSNSAHPAEPVYLQFSNTDTCSTWLALLRSYTIPEIYGRQLRADEGGSYRMWRQVELTVIQARNLGNPRPFDPAGAAVIGGSEEADPVDLKVSCEIHLNTMLCGRTTLKKGLNTPDWHEQFTFPDLPPFDTLDIFVWKETKLPRPTLMGSVRVTLSNFKRGEAIEGWFPVLLPGPTASDLQVGDIRLKIKVDEEIILPYAEYTNLLQTFRTRNFLDWLSDFDTKLKLKNLSHQFISIAVARDDLIEQVQETAKREVDGTPTSHQTLFRGNTTFSRVMESCMSWYGKAFLEASIGRVLRRLCADKVKIEVDFQRGTKGGKEKSSREVERNVDSLVYWCREFWNQIYAVRMECPIEMRRLFQTVREQVTKNYRISENDSPENRELPLKSVSAFCFLRFIVPAILNPHLFDLCPGLPDANVRRSLTSIAKVILSIANLTSSVQKEDYMRNVKDLMLDSRPAMVDYLMTVSRADRVAVASPSHHWKHDDSPDGEVHQRLAVVNALRTRRMLMPVLSRESIPMPAVPDVPKQLAIIASAVIRNARVNCPDDPVLHDFCQRCIEVEESALRRVSQMASRMGTEAERTRRPEHSSSLSVSASMPSPRKPRRPSTAPDRAAAGRRAVPQPSVQSPSGWAETAANVHAHRRARSSSTDSVSYPANPLSLEAEEEKKKRGIFGMKWRK